MDPAPRCVTTTRSGSSNSRPYAAPSPCLQRWRNSASFAGNCRAPDHVKLPGGNYSVKLHVNGLNNPIPKELALSLPLREGHPKCRHDARLTGVRLRLAWISSSANSGENQSLTGDSNEIIIIIIIIIMVATFCNQVVLVAWAPLVAAFFCRHPNATDMALWAAIKGNTSWI